MTDGTKRKPFVPRPSPAPEFDRVTDADLFRMLILTPLKLLFCILVVETYNLQLRFKTLILRLERCILTFRLRRAIKSQGETFAEYVRHRNLFQGGSGNINEAHNSIWRPEGTVCGNHPPAEKGGKA